MENGAYLADPERNPPIPQPDEPWPLIAGDIQDISFNYLDGKVDVLAGGPPCQPFSLGGVAKGDEDKRNMFPQMFRAIRQISPKAVICENVRGLIRPSFKAYFDYIVRELTLPFEERPREAEWREHDDVLRRRLDEVEQRSPKRYDVIVTPVNAADYGVPQIRNRIIIVAFRADLGIDIQRFKKLVEPEFSETALLHSMVDGEYWKRHETVPESVQNAVMARIPKALPSPDGKRPWRTFRDAIGGIDGAKPLPPIPLEYLDRTERLLDGFTDHVGWPGARIYQGHTPNELDRPAKTVKAGVHGVPGGESVVLLDDGTYRYMTVREAARVMTFPDEWKLEGPRGEKMRQLGNAVPVLLGEVFAKAVATVLREVDRD
ncbi:cytosine-specific methyltransferase [Planotetraspora silvatica]|uniref:DNA (cytosine-5-)-methyltransferase n=1 Tax=Planotetraspora silvatica TaxID=234614 RepID=A0A8J3UJZ2_9ACTN|nr:cytosine-specific methyltransferase [Planotetraspora silvatica]